MPTHYNEIDVSKWNTRHFHAYIADEHFRRYGVAYQPGRGWQAEAGVIGTLIGTQKKAGKYDKHVIKRFIDECFAEHRVSRQYPGVSFMWFYTYKKAVLQRIEAEELRKVRAVEADDKAWEGLGDWL